MDVNKRQVVTDTVAAERSDRLLAKIRTRQLVLARQGRVTESAMYAQRASRVRMLTGQAA